MAEPTATDATLSDVLARVEEKIAALVDRFDRVQDTGDIVRRLESIVAQQAVIIGRLGTPRK